VATTQKKKPCKQREGDIFSHLFQTAQKKPKVRDRHDKSTVDYEYDKMKNECTFKPNITKSKKKMPSVNGPAERQSSAKKRSGKPSPGKKESDFTGSKDLKDSSLKNPSDEEREALHQEEQKILEEEKDYDKADVDQSVIEVMEGKIDRIISLRQIH